MDKSMTTNEVLEKIISLEGAEFQYNEEAISKEFQSKELNQSSLAIKILSIFGGFLSTLSFLGFLAMTGLYNSEVSMVISGLIFISAAIWINRKTDKLIFDTFSISIFIAGIALLVLGLSAMNVNDNAIAVLVIFIASICLYLSQNYILSFISVLGIGGSLLAIIMTNNLYNVIHVYVALYTFLLCYWYLFEAKLIAAHPKLSRLYDPIRIGLVISFLIGLVFIGKRDLVPIKYNLIWISSIVIGGEILYIVKIISDITNVKSKNTQILIYGLSALIVAATFLSPAILGAILILLLSFLVNHKTGLAIGVISLIYFISQYYYDLNFTLLTKSIILMSSGVLFIAFYLFTDKMIKSDGKI